MASSAVISAAGRAHRGRWLLALLTLILAGLVLLASRQLPALVSHLLRQSLADPAATVVVGSDISIGLRGAGLEQVEVVFEQSGWRMALTLQQVQAGYHWRTLLGGNLQSLRVGRLQAQVQPLPTPEPAPDPDLATWLQQLEALRLPLATLHIVRAEIALRTGGDTVQMQLDDLVLDSPAQTLTGALQLRGDPAWLAALGEVRGQFLPSARPWLPALQLHTTAPLPLQAELQWPAVPASPLSASAQPSSLSSPAVAELPFTLRLQVPVAGAPVPVTIMDGTLQAAGADWSARGQLRTELWQLTGSWQVAQRGALRTGQSTLALASLPALLQSLTALQWLTPAQLALTSGSAVVKLGFSEVTPSLAAGSPVQPRAPAQPRRLDVQVEAGALSGSSAGMAFAGATLAATLRREAHWSTPQPLQLNVAEFGAGISASALQLQARLLPDASLLAADWQLQRLRFGLFGGEIALAEPVTLVLPERHARLALVVSGLQLGQILALYAQQGMSGEGTLNGVIPLTLTAAGAAIESGMLASTPAGGAIRYQPGAAGQLLGQSSQEVNMTLQILEDFRFSNLAVTTSLAADGRLLLGVQLAGNNPQVMAGHPVSLNVNLEENLYMLLQALQLSDQLSRRIEKKLSRPR